MVVLEVEVDDGIVVSLGILIDYKFRHCNLYYYVIENVVTVPELVGRSRVPQSVCSGKLQPLYLRSNSQFE